MELIREDYVYLRMILEEKKWNLEQLQEEKFLDGRVKRIDKLENVIEKLKVLGTPK